MNTILSFVAAVLPAVILLGYIYRRDPHKEPLSALVRAFLCGVAICVPVAFAEHAISLYLFGAGDATTLFGTTVKAFFVAAVPEEAAKLLALWLILRRNPNFDEHFDGIVYAVCVGLGFAAIENIGYVVGQADWMSVALGRAFLSVPGHYAFAIIMGYYYSLYHFVDRSPKNAMKMFLAPVMLHGVYDALAMSGSVDPLIGGIAFVVLVYFCIAMQKQALRRINELIKMNQQI